MAEVVGIAAASLLLVGVLISLWNRLRDLTVIDMYLLALAMFFGAYTIIDIAAVERHVDAVIVAYVLLCPCFAAIVLWGFAHLGSRRVLGELALSKLALDWERIGALPLLLALVPAFAYSWYTGVYFSEFAGLSQDQLAQLEADLPYWYTSLGMVATTLLWVVAPALWWKGLISSGMRRVFWWALCAASAALIVGYGRRMLFAFVVLVSITTLARMKRARLAALLAVVVLAPAFMVISNVYQAYRALTYRGIPLENVLDSENLTRDAVDAAHTIENLQDRQPIWHFNYQVVNANDNFQWGALFFGELPNYIPSALRPEKQIFDSEDELLKAFGLERYDRPNNVFALTYADFGYLGLVIAPALMLFFAWVFAAWLSRLTDPFLRLVLAGSAVLFALQTESDYLTIIPILRNFAVVAIVYLVLRGFARFWAFLFSFSASEQPK